MRTSQRCRLALLILTGLGFAIAPPAQAQPRPRPASATKADIERVDAKIEEQQRRIDKLIKLQLQYLQTLASLSDGAPPPPASPEPRPPEAKATSAKLAEPRPAVVAAERRPKLVPAAATAPPRKHKAETGNIVGKITGAADAVVYIDDIVVATRGTATMTQENKQFNPPVLVVQSGTTVQFPNLDAFFHNVFSVTPDSPFDLGSYRQGETRSITMSNPGVVSVYCNMHPQMVGHILVVPNGNYVRAGKDGMFRISNVPVGHHRIVAWAPEARPASTEAEVSEVEAVTVELELKRSRSGPHLKKDGLPYGSYDK